MDRKEYMRAWRAKHRERLKEVKVQWRKDNPEKSKAADRKWYEKNRDKSLARSAKWAKDHKEEMKRYQIAYRQAKMWEPRPTYVPYTSICGHLIEDIADPNGLTPLEILIQKEEQCV